MVQFASYLRRVLCKMRLIFPRINDPIVSLKFIISEVDISELTRALQFSLLHITVV